METRIRFDRQWSSDVFDKANARDEKQVEREGARINAGFWLVEKATEDKLRGSSSRDFKTTRFLSLPAKLHLPQPPRADHHLRPANDLTRILYTTLRVLSCSRFTRHTKRTVNIFEKSAQIERVGWVVSRGT